MKTLLNVRIDKELKKEIEAQAAGEEISPSEFARNILTSFLDYDEELKEIRKYEPIVRTETIILKPDIRQQLPKLTLLLFITRYFNTYHTETNLKIIKGLIEDLIDNEKLSNPLKMEFLKVQNDINRVLVQGIQNSWLMYTQPFNMYTLDYKLLFNEVYNLINRNYRDEK